MNSKWNHFEHEVWNQLKKYELSEKESYLLAISGGLDSMALMHVMLRLKPKAHFDIVHFHHGNTENPQKIYRDKALDFVKHKISCLNNSLISFHSDISNIELQSEEEFRNARWQFIRQVQKSNQVIMTGHHLDDWVETATLKMIRGTSLDGISRFQMWNGEIFRPFLETSKTDIKVYCLEQNISWVEDPSNASDDYLRNWVREKWFVELENKQSGAYSNFAKSLQRMLNDHSTFELHFFGNDEKQGLDRSWYLSLSEKDQLKALALYLKNQQIFSFTQGQLEEINKRLDKNQKDITFNLFRRKWVINATQIMLV